MSEGKVLSLYMTMPDFMRSGHRMRCENFECDSMGIMGDKDYETGFEKGLLLVSEKSYEIIEAEDLVLERGILMENIFVDIDLYHLKEGSLIEIGETLFEVTGLCHAYGYLYGFSPELPELLENKRGIFIQPVDHGEINLGDTVTVIKEA